jgi:hypothetical protein
VPDELVVLVFLVENAGVTHYLLRLTGIYSEIYKTAILYAVVVIYSPITTLITLPRSIGLYAYVQSVKAQAKADPIESFKLLLAHNFWGDIDITSLTLGSVILYTTGFLGLLTLTTFAECVRLLYRSTRFKTYVIVVISGHLVAAAYQWIGFPLHLFITYSAITGD